MADVAISYSSNDRPIAAALARDLTARGFDVWWDFALYAGDDFHDVIRAEIAKAKAVVVIWSEAAVASAWVRGEAVEASDLGKLISTHAPSFDPRKAPINFRTLHCEPVVNRERVVDAIKRKVVKVKTRQEVSIPAVPWTSDDVQMVELHSKAKAGDAESQFVMGSFHEFWYGDAVEAAYWYRRAMEQGYG